MYELIVICSQSETDGPAMIDAQRLPVRMDEDTMTEYATLDGQAYPLMGGIMQPYIVIR